MREAVGEVVGEAVGEVEGNGLVRVGHVVIKGSFHQGINRIGSIRRFAEADP
jgi:hypothetical protein